MSDEQYMKRAVALAIRGLGATSPNPAVGAVVVKGRRIVGEGFHRRAGKDHAEVIALRRAGKRSRGATLFVTLEPCCHRDKRTPPCVDAIASAGIREVVVAIRDPNPKVSGRGLRSLRNHGIIVRDGVLTHEAQRLIEGYAHWVKTGRPFVTVKFAATLDGKIATASGESKWITGTAARRAVHRLRAETDAILVGIGTVLSDDPELSVRGVAGVHAPYRVVLDERLAIPATARVCAMGRSGRTIVATTKLASSAARGRLESAGVTVLVVKDRRGLVDVGAVLDRLGRMNVTSVLVEGGSSVNASLLKAGVVDKVIAMIATKIMGGDDAIGAFGGRSPHRLADVARLRRVSVRRLGSDVIVEGYL